MKKLCIHCKHHKHKFWQRIHYCHYPDWVSVVDGGPRFCESMRDSPYRCTYKGDKWEPKDE